MTNIEIKLASFAQLVETQSIQRLHDEGLDCDANIDRARTRVVPGKKYAKIDIGTSGRYMVEISTGNIFGIKGYGVIHKGHFYGTLDTTADYFWGGYYPKKLDGTSGQAKGRGSCPALTFAPKTELVNGTPTVIPDGCHVVKNCVYGGDVVQAIDTPLACDVSRETYFCM